MKFPSILFLAMLLAAACVPRCLGGTTWLTLAWDPPVENLDGTPLHNLAGYVLCYGLDGEGYSQAIDVGNVTSAEVAGLEYGSAYVFAVKAYTDDGGMSDLSEPLLHETPAPTTVVGHPGSITTFLNRSATFSVQTEGVPPSQYQWRRNGAPIEGAIYATYVRRNVTVGDHGATFDVIVTSASGSVTSQTAILTVEIPAGVSSCGEFNWFEVNPDSLTVRTSPTVESVLEMGASSTDGGMALTFISTGGWHVVWARLADNGIPGSFFVSMNGGPEVVWQVGAGEGTDGPHWALVNDAAAGGSPTAWTTYLSAGTHTVLIRETEPGALLDLVLVTSDLTWNPETALTARDSTGDGISDDWKIVHFGSLDMPEAAAAADPDGDGMTNYEEFVAGTSGLDPESFSALQFVSDMGTMRVAFEAAEAAGPGYEGMRRYYALDARADMTVGTWQQVPGYEAILARNQSVVFLAPDSTDAGFYRLRIWLE